MINLYFDSYDRVDNSTQNIGLSLNLFQEIELLLTCIRDRVNWNTLGQNNGKPRFSFRNLMASLIGIKIINDTASNLIITNRFNDSKNQVRIFGEIFYDALVKIKGYYFEKKNSYGSKKVFIPEKKIKEKLELGYKELEDKNDNDTELNEHLKNENFKKVYEYG
jgi:hypothetical protein